MATLPSLTREAGLRARRWDVIVLGSGIRSLVAANRLALAGRRVLVVEEDAAQRAPEALREPFHLAGSMGGALSACLRELNVPLIDQRRITSREIAVQLVSPSLRVASASRT